MLDEMRVIVVNLTPSLSLSLCMVLASCSHCCRNLYGNHLTGTIPDSLGNLKSLQYL
jgi:hypothetical protein